MIHRIALILVVLWANLIASAQLTLPSYRQYTLRDGLSQMQVTCMLQDTRGYIWIGTKVGLNCFNGETFVRYTTLKYPEMKNDYIFQIREDSRGRIWAVTMLGILRIDGTDIKSFAIESNPRPYITCDGQGRTWFTKSDFPKPGFSINFIDGDSIYQFSHHQTTASRLPHLEICYSKQADAILFAHDSTLFRIQGKNWKELFHFRNLVLFYENQSGIWITETNVPGLETHDVDNFNLYHYTITGIQLAARIRNRKMIENSGLSDTLVIIPVWFSGKQCLISPAGIRYDAFCGLQVNQALQDRDKRLWVGNEEGVYQIFGDGIKAIKREYLPGIWAVTEDRNGNLWYSSYLNGQYKFNGKSFKHYPNLYVPKATLPYFHPSVDARGRIFIPNAYGILMIDGERFEQKTEQLYLTTYYDQQRDLVWAGRSKGAVAFDAKRNKMRTLDESTGLNVGNYVLTINRDHEGYYWFGGGKLARYNWKTGELKHYRPKANVFGVYSQCTDYKGRNWFATKNGLYYYNQRADSLVRIDREELADVVNLVGTIDSTWLMVSQPYGLYLMDLQKYYRQNKVELHLFNEKNGFTGIEPGQDGAFTDSKGMVWITTSTELMKLDPKKLATTKHSLTIRIDRCDGQKLPFIQKTIELPRNQNAVVLTFDAICFNRPNPVEYSWKMDKDTVWTAWQIENYAILSGLTDGNHRLKVRAQVKGLPLDQPAETVADLKVRVALYRQTWFFPTMLALVSLLVLLAIVLLVQTRTKMLQADKQAKTFQLQAILSQMNPHFIFNVMAALQSMILSANIEKANNYLVRMSSLVRGFLEASLSTSSSKSREMQKTEITLKKELDMLQTFIEFQQLIYPEKFDYKLSISPAINPEKITIPPMLIQPFVENAIRHGLFQKEKKGLLELNISADTNDQLLITISDDGIGIKKAGEIIRNSPLLYTSRGRELTEKRIKLLNEMGYTIAYKTKSSDQGTIITLILAKHEY